MSSIITSLTFEASGRTLAALGAGRFGEGVNLGVVEGTITGGAFGGLGSRLGVGGELLDDVTSNTTISGTYPI